MSTESGTVREYQEAAEDALVPSVGDQEAYNASPLGVLKDTDKLRQILTKQPFKGAWLVAGSRLPDTLSQHRDPFCDLIVT